MSSTHAVPAPATTDDQYLICLRDIAVAKVHPQLVDRWGDEVAAMQSTELRARIRLMTDQAYRAMYAGDDDGAGVTMARVMVYQNELDDRDAGLTGHLDAAHDSGRARGPALQDAQAVRPLRAV